MKIALQLYSLKNISAEQGLAATLNQTKALGYEGVEFAGFYDLTPEQAKQALDERGLACAGFHIAYDKVSEDVAGAIALCKQFGAPSLCIPSYSADSVAGWIAFAKELDRIGAQFRENGILFGFHNHRLEFQPIDGSYPMDLILENARPEHLFFELDPRHTLIAGVSPEEYIKRCPDRIPILHARDTDGEQDTAVGQGKVNFPAIWELIGQPQWAIVENENFDTNLTQLADSVTYLKQVFAD